MIGTKLGIKQKTMTWQKWGKVRGREGLDNGQEGCRTGDRMGKETGQ